jgi:hypothetical protein
MKCLSHNIDERYNSCNQLLNILVPVSSSIQKTNYVTNHITEITKEYILEYLKELYKKEMSSYVYNVPVQESDYRLVFYYCGRKSEVEFLSRLYKLNEIPSNDSKSENFEQEILNHTVNNNDFNEYWVFDDNRLGLNKGSDDTYLRFLCEMFHPAVRQEKSDWSSVLYNINELLDADGYEIYEYNKISNRTVYSYRIKI